MNANTFRMSQAYLIMKSSSPGHVLGTYLEKCGSEPQIPLINEDEARPYVGERIEE
jgi:hypothetical protein